MAVTLLVLHSAKPFSPNQPFCFPSSSTQCLKIHRFHNQRFIPRIPFSSFRNNNPLPETECPVPLDQQPVNEFKALSDSFPFSWASGDLVEYCSRLFATGLAFALFVGLPVNLFGSAGPVPEPLKPFLGAVSGGFIVVTLSVVRMYLGWAYVGNRLLSAAIEYEETGWYDGQVQSYVGVVMAVLPFDTSLDSTYPSKPFTRLQAKELKALQALIKRVNCEGSLHKHQNKTYNVWINDGEQVEAPKIAQQKEDLILLGLGLKEDLIPPGEGVVGAAKWGF